MKIPAIFLSILALAMPAAFAQTSHHVSAKVPVLGNSRELAAERPVAPTTPRQSEVVGPNANAWQLQATIPGAVIHDVSFSSTTVGYVAAELGQVWKTTNGGATWTEILNLGFPYYWYGVQAIGNNVVISGFDDSNFEGIIRFSRDGGTTWTNDIVLTTTGWGDRIHYVNSKDAFELDQLNLDAANGAHYTTDGGQAATDWTYVVPDPNGGWFGNQFSMLSNLHIRASGITYCTSLDGGATFTCGPSIDSVFDGPTFFINDLDGWVGGGEIAPSVEGWLHRTTDGGNSWTGRTLDISWPVREILFLTPKFGWAAGGNVFTGVGGMYVSSDGGDTWSQDANTSAEMASCDYKRTGTGRQFQVWCAGTNSSFSGVIYTLNSAIP
jgi:hypothetical protein